MEEEIQIEPIYHIEFDQQTLKKLQSQPFKIRREKDRLIFILSNEEIIFESQIQNNQAVYNFDESSFPPKYDQIQLEKNFIKQQRFQNNSQSQNSQNTKLQKSKQNIVPTTQKTSVNVNKQNLNDNNNNLNRNERRMEEEESPLSQNYSQSQTISQHTQFSQQMSQHSQRREVNEMKETRENNRRKIEGELEYVVKQLQDIQEIFRNELKKNENNSTVESIKSLDKKYRKQFDDLQERYIELHKQLNKLNDN